MLLTDRSLWTMVHGVVLGGAALMALAAALFAMRALRIEPGPRAAPDAPSRALAQLMVFIAVVLWVTVLAGTYIVFPPYRAPPPEGLADLSRYPRALLLSNPDTAWLHGFGMEIKEHMPWIAAMLATAVAFVSVRHPASLTRDGDLRRMAMVLTAVCFALVAFAGVLGVLIDKVAPLR